MKIYNPHFYSNYISLQCLSLFDLKLYLNYTKKCIFYTQTWKSFFVMVFLFLNIIFNKLNKNKQLLSKKAKKYHGLQLKKILKL